MITIIGVVAWVLCGVLAYGRCLAHFQRMFPTLRGPQDVVFAVFIGLTGPVGLIVAGIIWFINAKDYGFQFWPMKREPWPWEI